MPRFGFTRVGDTKHFTEMRSSALPSFPLVNSDDPSREFSLSSLLLSLFIADENEEERFERVFLLLRMAAVDSLTLSSSDSSRHSSNVYRS